MNVLLARDAEHTGDTLVLQASDEQIGDSAMIRGHDRSVTTVPRSTANAVSKSHVAVISPRRRNADHPSNE